MVGLDGAVESSVKLGVADAVADVVSTGSTLRAQGLEIFGPVILDSEAVLVSANPELAGISTLLHRLQGVLVARQYVLVDYDVEKSNLEGRDADHARHRVADDLAAPRPRLGRSPGDGPARGHEPGDGRPLCGRRAGDPRDRDPRREDLTENAMTLSMRVIPCLDVSAGRVVKGRELREPPRRRRSGRAREALRPRGGGRADVPRRLRDRRGPGDDVRRRPADGGAGVHPAHRRRRRPLGRRCRKAPGARRRQGRV